MDDHDRQQIYARFRLVCKECGSEDVTIDFDSGTVYSEYTSDPPCLTMGCKSCMKNDLILYV